MKKSFLALFLTGMLAAVSGQKYIADYSVAKEEVLRSIPTYYISKAKASFEVAFQRTSHGSHTSYGVYGLPHYKDGDDTLFAVTKRNPTIGALELRDQGLFWHTPDGYEYNQDLARPNEWLFVQTTRNFLEDPEHAHYNVIMWAWCDIADHDIEGNYLAGMDSLIREYGVDGTRLGSMESIREEPVHFIFMTGHPNRGENLEEGDPGSQAQLITDYCQANGYFCLDYYSIDSHDMDDQYWSDVGDNGDSDAYGGNFYEDWQASHVLGEHYFHNRSEPDGSIEFGDHLSQYITANRKAYAMWWILARMAGWDGKSSGIPVSEISISSEGDVSVLESGSTLQMYADVQPSNATDPTINWSVTNGTGSATITESGIIAAISAGMVVVSATSNDGSGASDEMSIRIVDKLIPVGSITVTADGGSSTVDEGASLQMFADILPSNASDPTVSWAVDNGTGSASISASGLLSAVSPGTVTVTALANDGSGVSGNMAIAIEAVIIPVSSIAISSQEGTAFVVEGATLQMAAEVQPSNATNTAVTWDVTNQTGTAEVSSQGLLSALTPGTVIVTASAKDGSGVTDEMVITINAAPVLVSSISLSTEGGVTEILEGSELQLYAEVQPGDASNPAIVWEVANVTGTASISQTGLLSADSEGSVEVTASAADGSGVSDMISIVITSVVGARDYHSDGTCASLRVFPNPVSDQLMLTSAEGEMERYSMHSLTGEEVMAGPLSNRYEFTLDVHSLAPGAYLLRIVCKGEHLRYKVLVL